VKPGGATTVRGIAFGGVTGVKTVELSIDRGTSWQPTTLGQDEGKYSFRQWQASVTLPAGPAVLMVRCTNSDGLAQPATLNWKPQRLHAQRHRVQPV